MRYVLCKDYRFKGWYMSPTGLYNSRNRTARFFPKDKYLLLLKCDGAHDLDEEELSEEDRQFLESLEKENVIKKTLFWEFLSPEQEYVQYPARYRESAQWSITGACNLKCRHCFMSAPHAKHGSPTHEQIIEIADQIAECGIFKVELTGGEPLIRSDFLDIIDALSERGIGVSTIFTNGWLVDEKLLQELDERRMHPNFQLSFDGVGKHDFLRGIDGAEERTLRALKLLQEGEYAVSVSMCLHKGNKDVLRESVNLMASYGVRSMKCGAMMELGEWMAPDVSGLQLSRDEQLELIEKYIPQYFEDDAPLSIMLADAFMYTPGESQWSIYDVRECPKEEESRLSCGVLKNHFYIGAEGMVAPCMGMCDCNIAGSLPNLFRTPLKEILRDSKLIELTAVTVGDVRDHNPKCRTCRFVDRCTGGCRNAVLMACDDYYGIDPDVCYFFERGWEDRIKKAVEEPFREYLKRNPPKEDRRKDTEESPENCP